MMEEPTEGVIRYQMSWTQGPPPDVEKIAELLAVRKELFSLGLIGWDEQEKVGYGNISVRNPDGGTFFISGTQTSGIEVGSATLFTEVTSSDPLRNELHCIGPVAASSEAMTHGMLYKMDKSINAVIHVHHERLWKGLLHHVHTTREEAGYGTPDMAAEISVLFHEGGLAKEKILAMAGHKDGLISFGSSPQEALEILLGHFNSL